MSKEAWDAYCDLRAQLAKANLALRNCRALASRNTARKGSFDDWQHILRFCEEAGIKAEILREGG